MKIAYLLRGKPEYQARIEAIPDHPRYVLIEAPEDGIYTKEQLGQVADADIVIVSNGFVNEQLLSAANRLKFVQRSGAGYEGLDLDALTRRGIPAANNPGANAKRVADTCLAMILSLARGYPRVQTLTREGRWGEARLAAKEGMELENKVLGIIGLGAIGFELARRARACDMRITYHNPRPVPAERAAAVNAGWMSLKELLAGSDVVSLNCPLTEQTRGLIGAAELASMKPSAYLVCAARGGIVDEAALRTALEEGLIAGAGLDNYATEPLREDDPLLRAPNLLLSPHVAAVTRDGSLWGFRRAFENARQYVRDGKRPQWLLNDVI